MTVVIDSTPTNFLNSSFVLLSFMETPHIHLITCDIYFIGLDGFHYKSSVLKFLGMYDQLALS